MQPNPIDHIINNILPKPYIMSSTIDDDCARGYNIALADCRSKLPEILDYVYAELRKEVEKLYDDEVKNAVGVYTHPIEMKAKVLSLLSTNQNEK